MPMMQQMNVPQRQPHAGGGGGANAQKPVPVVLEVGKRPVEPEPKYSYPEVKLPPPKRRTVETETDSCEAYLIFVNQDGKFIKTKLSTEVPELMMGRHPDCKLQISRDEQSISRFHAAVRCVPASSTNQKSAKGYKFIIRDQSSCGTGLNSSKVTQPLELMDGDRLFFGAAPFSLFFLRPKTCAHPSYEGEIQMQGTSVTKRWSTYHGCIARDALLLFDKKDDSLPKFVIDLFGATTVAGKKPPHSFTVTARGKSYSLAASSEELADEWLKAISVAVMNCRKNVLVGQTLVAPHARMQ